MAAIRAQATAAESGQSAYAVSINVAGHVFVGDEAVEAGGGGLGPAPFELLAAALAECTVMTIRWYARRQDWPVEHIEVAVDYSKTLLAGASTPVDVFEKTISIRGPGLTDQQRIRLLDVASKCPVQRTLESVPSVTTRVGTSAEQVAG